MGETLDDKPSQKATKPKGEAVSGRLIIASLIIVGVIAGAFLINRQTAGPWNDYAKSDFRDPTGKNYFKPEVEAALCRSIFEDFRADIQRADNIFTDPVERLAVQQRAAMNLELMIARGCCSGVGESCPSNIGKLPTGILGE
jgi:hypothetical protein